MSRVLGKLYRLPERSTRPFAPVTGWPRARLLADLKRVEGELAALRKVVETDLLSPLQPIGKPVRAGTEKLLLKRCRLLRRALAIPRN